MALLKDPNDFSEDYLLSGAKRVGLDLQAFSTGRTSLLIKEAVIESKLEGARNGVKETPTYFVDGHMYTGSRKSDVLLSFLRSY